MIDKRNLSEVVHKLKQKISAFPDGVVVKRLYRRIDEIEKLYEKIEIPEQMEDVYKFLVSRGDKLLKMCKKDYGRDMVKSIEYYIRYLKAASYDFKGEGAKLNNYVRAFLIMSMLFFALSPQYFGFLLPLMFIIPAYISLKGIKKRSKYAFRVSLTFVPVGIMVGSTWTRFLVYALQNYDRVILDTAKEINATVAVAKLFVFVPGILGIILIAVSFLASYWGYKCRDYFI
ncbi:hypothetical protein [Caldanaerobius polysaccharolyticus]|uniref:hypothetical protein n=1 Tax=Caldanaerobius polysaccharolyticus TaxID=44256 RepID=UPI00047BB63D|nr:hypothetical protein [Caldanaerobius polysaccharolyticus]